MTSIETKYVPPTQTRAARIKATTMSDRPVSVYVSWHIGINSPGLSSTDAKHAYAMRKLCEKLEWHGVYAMGDTAHGKVFVRIPGADVDHFKHDATRARLACYASDIVEVRRGSIAETESGVK